MRQEDRFSIVVSSSRRPRRVDYIIDSSSFHGCSFVRAWRPFLRPGLRVQTGRAQGVVKAGRRAGLPLASMLPGHALTEAQQVLHARCNWPLTSALPVTPDHSVDKKRSKHYRRRFVSLACQNEPAAPPRSYLLLEIARVVGLPVGPARARWPPHFGDNNPCRLNGLNGRTPTEIVDRRKERILPGSSGSPADDCANTGVANAVDNIKAAPTNLKLVIRLLLPPVRD